MGISGFKIILCTSVTEAVLINSQQYVNNSFKRCVPGSSMGEFSGPKSQGSQLGGAHFLFFATSSSLHGCGGQTLPKSCLSGGHNGQMLSSAQLPCVILMWPASVQDPTQMQLSFMQSYRQELQMVPGVEYESSKIQINQKSAGLLVWTWWESDSSLLIVTLVEYPGWVLPALFLQISLNRTLDLH